MARLGRGQRPQIYWAPPLGATPAAVVVRDTIRTPGPSENAARRKYYARARRRDPIILRAPVVVPAAVRQKQPLVFQADRRAAYRRAHSHQRARIVVPASVAQVRQDRIHVTRQAVARKARVWRFRQQPVTILRAPLAPVPAQRAKQPLVKPTGRSRLLRKLANHALIVRAPSAPTAVPLVRPDKIEVSREAVRRRWQLARNRRRDPQILRAPSTPTVTFVRPTILVSETATRRRQAIVRSRRRDPILLRAPLPLAVTVRQAQPVVRTTRKSRYVRALAGRTPIIIRSRPVAAPPVRANVTRQAVARKARVWRLLRNTPILVRPPKQPPAAIQPAKQPLTRITRKSLLLRKLAATRPVVLRAPSTPTATPLVRDTITVSREAISRRAKQLRLRRRDPIILRAPLPAPVAQKPKQPVVRATRRAAVVARARHNNATIIRSRVAPPPPAQRVTVSHQAQTRKARVYRASANKPILVRPRVTAPIVQKPRQPIVRTTRKSRYLRVQANHAIILRARSTPTATPLVRNRVKVNHEAVHRKSRWLCLGRGRRIQPHLLRRPIGDDSIPFTGYFDFPTPNSAITNEPRMSTFTSNPHSQITSAPRTGVFEIDPELVG